MTKITKKVTPKKTATKRGGKKIQKTTKGNVAKKQKVLASAPKAKVPTPCEICGAQYFYRSGKSRHVKEAHGGNTTKGRPKTGGR
jgi:hypothetical protein